MSSQESDLSAYRDRARGGKLFWNEAVRLRNDFRRALDHVNIPVPSIDDTYTYAAQKRAEYLKKPCNDGKKPRPLNQFILFCWRFSADAPFYEIYGFKELAMRYKNQLAGIAWRALRKRGDLGGWEALAGLLKEQQGVVYPGYGFTKKNSSAAKRRSARPEVVELAEEVEIEGGDTLKDVYSTCKGNLEPSESGLEDEAPPGKRSRRSTKISPDKEPALSAPRFKEPIFSNPMGESSIAPYAPRLEASLERAGFEYEFVVIENTTSNIALAPTNRPIRPLPSRGAATLTQSVDLVTPPHLDVAFVTPSVSTVPELSPSTSLSSLSYSTSSLDSPVTSPSGSETPLRAQSPHLDDMTSSAADTLMLLHERGSPPSPSSNLPAQSLKRRRPWEL